jgi:hypothetical protein
MSVTITRFYHNGAVYTDCKIKNKYGVAKNYQSEYKIYEQMIYRCYKYKHLSYPYYGARGIGVCQRWLEGFENFLEDMGQRPKRGLQIDRINNDDHYHPDNCRWTDTHTQIINRGRTTKNISGFKGIHWVTSDQKWRITITRNRRTMYYGWFNTVEEARKHILPNGQTIEQYTNQNCRYLPEEMNQK